MGLRNRSLLKNEQCFFVTTTCHNWLRLLNTANAVNIVIESLNFLTDKYKCHILGYVIMPNHLHLILYFPEQNNLSNYMCDFKKFTSVKLRHEIETGGKIRSWSQVPWSQVVTPDSTGTELLDKLRYEQRRQKFKVWMDRFDDVCITSADTLRVKLNYIHNNPLQDHWQLAGIPEEYAYSSAGFYDGKDNNKLVLTNYGDFIW